MNSVRRTHRALIVDEGWRSGGIAAEIGMRITEQAFFELDAPVARICTAEVPIPYPKHLETGAASVEVIVVTAEWSMGHELRMPSRAPTWKPAR
jgi:pyruvate dehydrogenase E1 component beta subunit